MEKELDNRSSLESEKRVKSSTEMTKDEIINVYLKDIPKEETREQMEKRIRNFCMGW